MISEYDFHVHVHVHVYSWCTKIWSMTDAQGACISVISTSVTQLLRLLSWGCCDAHAGGDGNFAQRD